MLSMFVLLDELFYLNHNESLLCCYIVCNMHVSSCEIFKKILGTANDSSGSIQKNMTYKFSLILLRCLALPCAYA